MTDDHYFWPEGVICLPWLSQHALRQQRAGNPREDYKTYNRDHYEHYGHYDNDDMPTSRQNNRYSILEDECCGVD
jgi:hypothetical protein